MGSYVMQKPLRAVCSINTNTTVMSLGIRNMIIQTDIWFLRCRKEELMQNIN